MMITIVLAAILILLLMRCMWQIQHLKKKMNKIDGPPTLPLLGNILFFMDSPENIFKRLNQLYQNFHGRPFRLRLFNKSYIFLNNPAHIHIASRILDRDSIQGFFSDLLGNGIFTVGSDEWQRSRRIMYSAFNTTVLSTHFLNIFNKQSRKIIQQLERDVDVGNTFDVYSYMVQCSLQTIFKTALGSETQVDEETFKRFGINIIDTELITKRMARPWLYPSVIFKVYTYTKGYSKIFKEIRDFLIKVIKEKIEKLRKVVDSENANDKPKSMMEILLKNQGSVNLTEERLADEFLTLLLAGSETNALTISFTLLMLAMHQDIQNQVYEELLEKFGNDNRDPTSQDLMNLKFLGQCINETLRKFSILPVTVRYVKEDLRISDDLIIPSGANVTLPFNRVHNDPDLYPNPEIWDPHNFDLDRVTQRPLYSFMPFGTGPRMCIGHKYAMLSTKAMISRIIRNFKLTTSQTHVELYQDILMRSRNGYNIELHYRHS